MSKKTVLIITDGIGHNSSCSFNAFCNAKKPTYDYLFSNVPYSLIHTYGEYVGLPENQMGNSEVGHMTIGSGRVLYQDLVKIHLAIKNDTLKDIDIVKNTISNSNSIHLIGLLSDGGVHSHIDHIISLAKISQNFGKKVWLHLITDGRDVAPNCAKTYINQILDICNENIKIASIGGRYYGMDRDNRWERVELAYNSMVFATPKSSQNILDLVDNSYKSEVFDEFIIPTAFDGFDGIKDGDGVIFCNFRSDRARELSSIFVKDDFKEFPIKKLKIKIASMTQYDKNVEIPVIFPKDNPTNTLAQVISDAGLSQLHTAETEKYAHVTFFFNGGVEEPFLNETRVLVPSPNVATYDLQPQMSAPEVGEAVRIAIKNEIDFIVVNFANGDMVGHTGVYEAAVKAVEAVDYELGLILKEAKNSNYNIILTSDHGNCEMMKDENGNILTNHTVGDVYCFVISPTVTKVKEGSLNNIAPTILKLMELPIPKEMDEALI
ncbi:2,3-bisphosphoglycerate-independent phosphoglycerate mutase [Aliarcobacter cryaerophilus]|uniref:2,3-bisphosphoglycerate-independent phosphoglycerate mutase n=1 Tax=Aliarcobacter cryaerophilus TaxID=28198 RepID=UPI003DA5699D